MTRRIAIIGGGLAGTLAAANLLRNAGDASIQVTLIEPRTVLGQGVAYSTVCPLHVLNVPAGRMSAWIDHPRHFIHYALRDSPDVHASDFLQRSLYGRYMRDIFADTLTRLGANCKFDHIQAKCVSAMRGRGDRVTLNLDHGEAVDADCVVLTAGNFPPTLPGAAFDAIRGSFRFVQNPWRGLTQVDNGDSVLLIGTGLTAVDAILELVWRGHTGSVIALSRHGFLPLAHLHRPTPVKLDIDQASFLGSVRRAFHHTRKLSRQCEWQNAIDALRPHTVAIWRSWPLDEQRRFLRHARAFFDIHRHRIPAQVAETMANRIADSKLEILAGRVRHARESTDGLQIEIQLRAGGSRTLAVSHVVNCTGPDADITRFNDPLFRQLLETGSIVPHPLRQGAETTVDGALVDAQGRPSDWLFTVGTLRKPATWESIAVPEIAAQAHALANHLLTQSNP